MTEAVFQFKAIAKRLNCQEQKAEFEEKNPPVDLGMYGYPSNLTVPFCAKTNLHNILGDLKTELSMVERLHGAVVKI